MPNICWDSEKMVVLYHSCQLERTTILFLPWIIPVFYSKMLWRSYIVDLWIKDHDRKYVIAVRVGSLLRKYGNQCIVKLFWPPVFFTEHKPRTDKVCPYTYVHILHLSSCCLATLSSNAMYVQSVYYIEHTYFLCWEIIWSLPNCVVARLYDVTCSSLSTVHYAWLFQI